MPIYVLKCKVCGTIFEVICSYDLLKEKTCKECDEEVEILPATSGFRVEGYSYENGYCGSDDSYDPNIGRTAW